MSEAVTMKDLQHDCQNMSSTVDMPEWTGQTRVRVRLHHFPPPFTKNCRQRRSAEIGRKGLLQARADNLVIQYQVNSSENIHTNDIIEYVGFI